MNHYALYTKNPFTECWHWMCHPGTDSADAFQRAEREGWDVQYGPRTSVVLSTPESEDHYRRHS